MSRKNIEIKHHLSSGCCMCSGIEDLYATKTNQSIPEGFPNYEEQRYWIQLLHETERTNCHSSMDSLVHNNRLYYNFFMAIESMPE